MFNCSVEEQGIPAALSLSLFQEMLMFLSMPLREVFSQSDREQKLPAILLAIDNASGKVKILRPVNRNCL